MKRCTSLICSILLIFSCAASAFASNFYIIPDSNTRRLTREELWTWQYDALAYIFNEIFARHGYHFEPGGKFDNYFRSQTWYQENPIYDNQGIYKNLMTNIEWYNERLAKEVREEMRALGTTNPNGKAIGDITYEPEIYGAFSQFQLVYFAPNQKLPVYSGPGTHYHRSANGKALASTNGYIYVGGWENGWLQIMYWTNDYNVRVGYTQSSNFKDKIDVPHLRFDYVPATITRRIALTDDPVASFQPMATLEAGTRVTYLTEAYNEKHWAYVEATVGGTMMRGYIEADAVSMLSMQEDEPSLAPAGVVAEMETENIAEVAFPEVMVDGKESAETDDYIKHRFWGIGPENWDSIALMLEEKGIPYKVSDRGAYIPKEQPLLMFGIPVDIDFVGGFRIDILSDEEWNPSGDGPISDTDLQKVVDAYTSMSEAAEAQYGPPTGGHMATWTREPRTSNDWSYPLKGGQLDLEIVRTAVAQKDHVVVEIYNYNLNIFLYVIDDGKTHSAGVWMQYCYDRSISKDEYTPPTVEEMFSFKRPDGDYTTEPRTIEIGF